LSKEAKEGDVLKILINIDREETEKRRRKIESFMDELFE